jgi:biopolymer transport protein ExbD
MSRKKIEIQEEISPNLIPMIDIMFLLLLFFMLGADMGQRELEEVFLPKAVALKEDSQEQTPEVKSRLTVNIYHRYATDKFRCDLFANGDVCRDSSHWLIGIKGKNYSDPKKLEAQLKVESGADPNPPAGEAGKKPKFSERSVMVRADASAPYRMAQQVITTCAKAGIYKIEVGAARPPDKELAGVAGGN